MPEKKTPQSGVFEVDQEKFLVPKPEASLEVKWAFLIRGLSPRFFGEN